MQLPSSASSVRTAIVVAALWGTSAFQPGCGSSAAPAALDENESPAGGVLGGDDNSERDAEPGATPAGSEPWSDAGEFGATSPDGLAPGSYPAGPYGENNPGIDDVVENLSFRGLLNLEPPTSSSSLEVAPLSFQTFRESDARYLLVITSMAWCGSCQVASRQLGADLLERVTALRDEGGLVAHVLLQGGGSARPTDAELSNWAQAGNLSISVLGPVDDEAARVFPQREWVFVLRLDTMQVVWREQVSLYATPTTSQLGVAQLEALVASGS